MNRYILTAMPAFIYFVIYGLEYIFRVLNNGFENFSKNEKPINKKSIKSKLSYIVPIVLIILFIVSAVNFTSTVEYSKGYHEDVSNFLIQHDPDYSSKVIMADSFRFFSWYLNTEVLSHHNVDEKSLESSNVTYLITFDKIKSDKFHRIYKSGGYKVYERNTPV